MKQVILVLTLIFAMSIPAAAQDRDFELPKGMELRYAASWAGERWNMPFMLDKDVDGREKLATNVKILATDTYAQGLLKILPEKYGFEFVESVGILRIFRANSIRAGERVGQTTQAPPVTAPAPQVVIGEAPAAAQATTTPEPAAPQAVTAPTPKPEPVAVTPEEPAVERYIREVQPARSTTPAAQTDPRRAQFEARVSDLMARYPLAYNDDGSRGDPTQAMHLNNEIARMNTRPMNYSPASYPADDYDVRAMGGYGSANMGRSWNGLPYFWDLMYSEQGRRIDYAWTTARIKIKGERFDDNFLSRVSVVALVPDNNGGTKQYVVGDANQHNGWMDRDIVVPIRDHEVTLLFILEDGTPTPRAFGRTLWLEPQAVRRGAQPVMVNADKLRTARDQYDLRRHVFVENASGEITRR